MPDGGLDLPGDAEGVLPAQHLRRAIATGVISADSPIPDENVQPASLDLRLGEVAYRLQYSFLPSGEPVERKLKDYVIDELDLTREGAVLETRRPYLIPLREKVCLPPGIRGKANPKSSTGRVDVFTRVITDNCFSFDEIAAGYEGALYLEVVPLSFAVRVREDLSLNQLRLSRGRALLGDDELRARHEADPVLFRDGAPIPVERLALSGGLFLSLDLGGDRARRIGYRARESAPLLDMSKRARPNQYWERVTGSGSVVLNPKSFYLLMSAEAVRIPPTLASEMTAYDPTSGELRSHYAGFFDPGFGYSADDKFRGSRAALEVRAHDVQFVIERRQWVSKLTFEHMLEAPDVLYGSDVGSSYQRQEEILSKHFSRTARVTGQLTLFED